MSDDAGDIACGTGAPGRPGIAPRWTSSAKSGVGTAFAASSRVWFTLSHGIVNEVYWPRVDRACTRDLGLIVTSGRDFFAEEKRHARSVAKAIAPGVPAYRLVNTCAHGRYRVEKEVLTDPRRDALVQVTRFVPLLGTLGDYRVYVLLAPHLGNRGSGNTAWLDDYKGIPMLFAARDGDALALATSVPWRGRSVGFVGVSDGWQDLARHRELTWQYQRAENGNVALTGGIDLMSSAGEFRLVLGFGRSADEAAHHARASLLEDYRSIRETYLREWSEWQAGLLRLDGGRERSPRLYTASTAILRTHEDKVFPGGMIASLSVPWGFAKGDDDLGGYHLIWPRDLAEAGGALLACGARADASRVLRYLEATQEADGHWAQNLWLDGMPYWNGIQMDETALPILLVDLAHSEASLPDDELRRLWPMVRRAASFLVRNGPVTGQDRWEEDAGYSPFTLAVEVAALLVAANLAELVGEVNVASYLQETADCWNATIERWTYVSGTPLARRLEIGGYYVRVAPEEGPSAASPTEGFVPIKNRPPGETNAPAAQIVSVDALALVRFGLRSPHDPRVVDTVKAIDALLRVETPHGPAWHRYNGDGYGEHDDGAPFDGMGVGRAWPLLVGERAHYELAAGRPDEARRLLSTIEAFATTCGLLPEQVWDGPDLPERELLAGRPSGSAMPLVWAHAEYIKLLRSIHDGRVFDTPRYTLERYVNGQTGSELAVWRFNHKCRTIAVGRRLRIEALAPALVHWSVDHWRHTYDTTTRDSGLGIHFADLPTDGLAVGSVIDFTFYWPTADRWENVDFAVSVIDGSAASRRGPA